MRKFPDLLFLALVAALLIPLCSSTVTSPLPTCPPGTANCPCDLGGCNSGLQCVSDFCLTMATSDNSTISVVPSTAETVLACGSVLAEGCACIEDIDECEAPLSCFESRCTCKEGTKGCPCDNEACDVLLTCVDELCETDNFVLSVTLLTIVGIHQSYHSFAINWSHRPVPVQTARNHRSRHHSYPFRKFCNL